METGKRAVVVWVGVKGDVSYKGAQGKVWGVLSLFYILVWWWLPDSMCLSKLTELDSKKGDFSVHMNYIYKPAPKVMCANNGRAKGEKELGSLMTSWSYHTCPSI